MNDVPASWLRTTLGELGTWVSGGTPQRSNSAYYGGIIPWVKTGELRDTTILRTEETLTTEGVENSAAKVLPKGTLLVAMYGATIGRLGILGIDATTNQACAALIANDATTEIIPFLFYYLLSQRDSLRLLGQGGAQPNISLKVLKDFPCILPPLAEQRRVVAKIESLTAHVRQAKRDLEAIPSLVEQSRNTLLSSAFRGELTTDWRQKNPQTKSADELLVQVREERRIRWEAAELAKMQAKGTMPTDERWKMKYAPPSPVDTNQTYSLPDGWTWASFEEVTLNFDSDRIPLKSSDRSVRSGQYPYYGASGIIDDINDFLFDGDYLLVAEDGANLLSRSTPIAFEAHGRFWVNNHAHIVQPVELPMAYLREYLESLDLTPYVTGTAQPKLTQRNLNSIPVPVAPPEEAAEIACLVDSAHARARVVLTHHTETLAALQAQEQSILAKAFRGELVPQDPNDEPASVLMERLRPAANDESALSKPSQPRPRKPMKKTSAVDRIKDAILEMPSGEFSFEDLRKKVSGDYDMLKDKVFELLQEHPPLIRQVFDKQKKRNCLERVDP